MYQEWMKNMPIVGDIEIKKMIYCKCGVEYEEDTIYRFCPMCRKKSWRKRMKNKIILGIILIVLIFCLSGCNSESKTEEVPKRLVTIYKQDNFSILVDTRTNVEYMLYANNGGYKTGGAGGLTVLLNQDGTPLLYGGE